MSMRSGVALAALFWAGLCTAEPTAGAGCEYESEHCTDIRGGLSSACMAELDRRYLDAEVRYARPPKRGECAATLDDSRSWSPLPARGRIVWRDLFGDPLALRRAVAAAAGKPQCQAMAGEARHALREACAADAFARLALLHRTCGGVLAWDASPDLAAEFDVSAESFMDPWDRRSFGDRPVEAERQFAWRVARCRSVPKEALRRIETVQPPPLGWGRRFRQHRGLGAIAARLGSVWAIAQRGQTAEEVNATARANIGLAYLGRANLEDDPAHRLAFLLVAREHDLRRDSPQIDWSELPLEFSEGEIQAARPVAERLLREGWQPLPEPREKALAWPWAIAPPVVATRYIARRYDRYGNVRWVYPNGAEHWFGPDGTVEIEHPDEDGEGRILVYHTQMKTAGRVVRRWTDEAGNQRWADLGGHEHWVDDDGAERWVDWGGTEWVLLPIGVPLPEDAE